MDVEQLDIAGAYVFTPRQFADPRGAFMETFKESVFREATGHGLHLAQGNCSISQKGVVRGIHFADVPPSQAKYVMCASGAILDVVIDIRVGSPTFGQWRGERLDDVNRRALYLSEGLGHAFMALTDNTTVVYLCSEGYAPEREHGVHPLDPEIGIAWPDGIEPLLSEKDAAAPTLAQMAAAGALPTWEQTQAFRESLI
jgi:dTDP-4-dehydrorhamnose 3,5-epimerase